VFHGAHLTLVGLWYPPSILTGPFLNSVFSSCLSCTSAYNALVSSLCICVHTTTYHPHPHPHPSRLFLLLLLPWTKAGLVFTRCCLFVNLDLGHMRFTRFLHSAGLRGFCTFVLRRFSFSLYFPIPSTLQCFVPRHEIKIDMRAPVYVCCRSSLTAEELLGAALTWSLVRPVARAGGSR
jgi:hypothetical protein